MLASLDAEAYPLHVFSDFDRERRRIEEALHDGVQQDLAATVVALELARELLDSDPAAARSLLDELATQVEGALDRVRALAGTVYPSILSARGLTDALRSLDVETADLERYPLEIEEAVYFSCRALRSRAVRARVWGEGAALRFELLPGVAEAVASLQRRGLALAVVGNWDMTLPDHLAEVGLGDLAVVTSAGAGAAKPDPRPFRLALEELGVRPERALHIGNEETDDLGAKAAGMHFAWAPVAAALETLE